MVAHFLINIFDTSLLNEPLPLLHYLLVFLSTHNFFSRYLSWRNMTCKASMGGYNDNNDDSFQVIFGCGILLSTGKRDSQVSIIRRKGGKWHLLTS
jgi:hypothetical protein